MGIQSHTPLLEQGLSIKNLIDELKPVVTEKIQFE